MCEKINKKIRTYILFYLWLLKLEYEERKKKV
jgi:hypothetical protein